MNHDVLQCTYSNGDVYEGQWSNDQRQGRGKLTVASNGNVYVGDWAADKMSGSGDMTYGPSSPGKEVSTV